MSKLKPLHERIAEIRAEADSYLDDKAKEVAKDCPGIPLGNIRNMITNRAPRGCECQAVLSLQEQKQ
jgi:hypothetical protein